MKIKNIILILTAAIVVACAPEEKLEFGLDTDRIEIDCYGGVRTFQVTSSETEGTPEQRSWEGNGLSMLRRRNNISKTKGTGDQYGYSLKKKKKN